MLYIDFRDYYAELRKTHYFNNVINYKVLESELDKQREILDTWVRSKVPPGEFRWATSVVVNSKFGLNTPYGIFLRKDEDALAMCLEFNLTAVKVLEDVESTIINDTGTK